MRTFARASILVLLTGCRGETVEAKPDVGTKSEQGELYARAHRDAMIRTGDLAMGVLELEDPLGAAMLGMGPLEPPPVSARVIEPLRDAQKKAWVEAREVDATVLSPTERTFLLAMRFGLDRVNDRVHANQPARSDATWYPAEALRYVDGIRAAIAFGPCEACGAGLSNLAGEIEAASAALGAAAPGTLAAAEADWGRVDAALAELAGHATRPGDVPTEVVEAARAAVAEARRILSAQQAGHDDAPAQLWGSAVAPAGGRAPAILPRRIGAKAFQRRLFVEERLTGSVGDHFQALGPALEVLKAMEAGLGQADAPSRPGPFTLERCEAAAGRALAFAATHPILRKVEKMSCEGLQRLAGTHTFTDGELSLFVIDHGIVMPARMARRASESAPLAVLGGRIAERSQLLAQSVAISMGMKDDAASRIAVRRAREAGCLAAAALWVHGELGDDAGLTTRLEKACSFGPAAELITAAELRPRSAVLGFGLWVTGASPAEMAALDQYWWAPMGLVLDLAQPDRAGQPKGPDLAFKVEAIEAGEDLQEAKEAGP